MKEEIFSRADVVVIIGFKYEYWFYWHQIIDKIRYPEIPELQDHCHWLLLHRCQPMNRAAGEPRSDFHFSSRRKLLRFQALFRLMYGLY